MTALVKTKAFENGVAPLQSDIVVGLASLAATASIRRLKAGETLYVEGDQAPYCYQVANGMMKEYNTLEDGRRQVAEFYTVGELFGISETEDHLHTAEAVTECVLRCYPRDAYMRGIAASPELSHQLIDTLMTRLYRARERMIMLGRMSAAQRVANFLLRLSADQNTTNDIQFAMSRQDIADHLGLSIETVCRVLTIFKKHHIIDMKNARLFDVTDLDALENTAYGMNTQH